MSFRSFFKLLEEQRRIPDGVPLPRAHIQLGPVTSQSSASLQIETPVFDPAARLTEQQLQDLTTS